MQYEEFKEYQKQVRSKLTKRFYDKKTIGLFFTGIWCQASNHLNNKTKSKYVIGIFFGFFIPLLIDLCLASCSSSEYLFQEIEDPFTLLQVNQTNYPENSDRNLLFVGVMTAHQYLDTRAVAVHETWGQQVPGNIAFFTSENSFTSAKIPLVRLPGVDDSYPPQKKSFMMLKYMHDHFLNHFEFFMRADDDLYVRTDKLEDFLRSVNSSELHFIGQTGKG